MDYAKTLPNAFAESSMTIRPGTICKVELTGNIATSFVWDSAVTFNHTFSGYTDIYAVHSIENIPYNKITITRFDSGEYGILIKPINKGVITIRINNYQKLVYEVQSIPAFTSSNIDYYKDFEVIDNVLIPMTIIPYPEGSEVKAYKVTPYIENNGIAVLDNNLITTNSVGCLEWNGGRLNILKKGKSIVAFPLDSAVDDSFVIKVNNIAKTVEFDSQEWIVTTPEQVSTTYGILNYYEHILVMTNNGLYVFDRFRDFITPEFHFPGILGTDLTYTVDDCVAVASGNKISKYKIRHDLIYIDTAAKRLYFRERTPYVRVSI